nr:immunoglobulin heavy chain junction region [Mus musculus]
CTAYYDYDGYYFDYW